MAFPFSPGAFRVLLVGFRNLVAATDQGAVGRLYRETISKHFGTEAATLSLPHLAIAEHLGFELKTSGAKIDFWSPHAVGASCDQIDPRFLRLIWDACANMKGKWSIRS